MLQSLRCIKSENLKTQKHVNSFTIKKDLFWFNVRLLMFTKGTPKLKKNDITTL